MGLKAPRGYGWITNPKRAAYNRVYNRTTFKADSLIALVVVLVLGAIVAIVKAFFNSASSPSITPDTNICPRCSSTMILRNGRNGNFYGCSRFPRCRGTRPYTIQNASVESGDVDYHIGTTNENRIRVTAPNTEIASTTIEVIR